LAQIVPSSAPWPHKARVAMARASSILFLLLVGVVAADSKSKADRAKCDVEDFRKVRQELADLKAKGASPSHKGGPAFSPVGAATQAWKLGKKGVHELLDKISVDEKFVHAAAVVVRKAGDLTAGIWEKASNVNYASYMQAIKTNEIYLTRIAPHIDAAAKKAEPFMNQYVGPAVEHAGKACAAAAKTIEKDVLPVLKQKSVQAAGMIYEAPNYLGAAQSWLDQLTAPMFDAFARVAPEYASAMPEHPVDRVIFLFVSLFFGYHLFVLMLRLGRIVVFLARLCFKIFWAIVRFFVLLPLRVALKMCGIFLWFGTCFCCCGLCRRKRNVEKLKVEATRQTDESNAKMEAKQSGATPKASGTLATVDEVVKLLELGKKDKKLESAAKQLASLVRSGKALSSPKSMAGKTVTKDVFTKAVGKFKELNIKTFNV